MSTQATSPGNHPSEIPTNRSLEKDELFHLLQNGRRRAIIRYLHAHGDQSVFDMRPMAEQVAAWENGKSASQLDSQERQRVYIALYQSHLPKLAEAGVISYNQTRGRIEPTVLLAQLEPYLTNDSKSDDSSPEQTAAEPAAWDWYYAGATGLSIVLLTAVTLGVAPAVVAGSLAIIIIGLFTTITVGMRYRDYTS